MEGTQTTTREEGTTERNGDQWTSSNVLMSSKPLHRFVQKEPRCFGIVSLMFGCAELLMGLQMFGQELMTCTELYIPIWQGALVRVVTFYWLASTRWQLKMIELIISYKVIRCSFCSQEVENKVCELIQHLLKSGFSILKKLLFSQT